MLHNSAGERLAWTPSHPFSNTVFNMQDLPGSRTGHLRGVMLRSSPWYSLPGKRARPTTAGLEELPVLHRPWQGTPHAVGFSCKSHGWSPSRAASRTNPCNEKGHMWPEKVQFQAKESFPLSGKS